MKLNVEAHEGDLSKMGCMILNHYIEYNKQRKQDPDNLFLGLCIMDSMRAKIKDDYPAAIIEKIEMAMTSKDYLDFILFLASFPEFSKPNWTEKVNEDIKEFVKKIHEDSGVDFAIEACLNGIGIDRRYACLQRRINFPKNGQGISNIDKNALKYHTTDGFMTQFANVYVREKLKEIINPDSFYNRFPGCLAVLSEFRDYNNSENLVCNLKYFIPIDSVEDEIVRAAIENAAAINTWNDIL